MKLYHFMTEKYGLEAIKNREIKVSTLDDLNDSFEMFAINWSDGESITEESMKGYKSLISVKTFFLCMSQSYASPLLWEHYADKHKGVALEFDVPDSMVSKVKYQKSRMSLGEANNISNTGEGRLLERLLTTKYIEWSYEDEARILLNSNDIIKKQIGKQNLKFYKYDEKLELKAIWTGSLSKLKAKQIEQNLPNGKHIKFKKTKMAANEFHIVQDRSFKTQTLYGS